MTSKDRAKAPLAKFYLQGELTIEESIALNDFAKRTSYQASLDELKEDPRYEELMPQIELYREILKE